MQIKKALHNRKYRIIANGVMSDQQDVMSGVPQGTVLASILFFIMILDKDENLKTICAQIRTYEVLTTKRANGKFLSLNKLKVLHKMRQILIVYHNRLSKYTLTTLYIALSITNDDKVFQFVGIQDRTFRLFGDRNCQFALLEVSSSNALCDIKKYVGSSHNKLFPTLNHNRLSSFTENGQLTLQVLIKQNLITPI